jgi:hypothetical protein
MALLSFQQSNQVPDRPQPVCHSSRHRRSNTERLIHAGEVVRHIEQCDLVHVVKHKIERVASLLRFVLTPLWPAPSLHPRHPLRWTAPTFSPAVNNALEYGDCLINLLALLSQRGEHFHDVHLLRGQRKSENEATDRDIQPKTGRPVTGGQVERNVTFCLPCSVQSRLRSIAILP